jgi:hypothetical protein
LVVRDFFCEANVSLKLNLTALAVLSVDLKFITVRVFGFLFKIHFNPPQTLSSGLKSLTGFTAKRYKPPLAVFHILFNFVTVHRENPKTAPTYASNST